MNPSAPPAAALHLRGVVLPDGEERDLWVHDGRLRTQSVPGAQTVVRGGWLLPGLVDAHCHIGIGRGEVPLADVAAARALALVERDAGVLTIRDAGSPLHYPEFDDDRELPRLMRAGRHLAPPKRYLRGYAVDVEAEELPEQAATQARRGNGWVKLVGDWIDRGVGDLTPTYDDATFAAAISSAHAEGARVAVHTFSTEALPGLIAAGVDSIEHGTGLTPDLIDALAASGAALVPTMVNINTFPAIAAAAEARFPTYAARMARLHADFPGVIRAAHEAGVPIYVGTDAGGNIAHGLAATEMRLLHAAGLPIDAVLAAGSWGARAWLGLPGLTEGAPADVVAYDRDPRTDLTALAEPARIILRGRVVR
jgi:imidazolonepropionase-like amidohydrolase